MTVRQVLVIGACTALIVGGAIAAYGITRSRPSLRADPNDHEQVSAGSQLYATACASCHGKTLEGQPSWMSRLADGGLPAPPHDETGHTWHHPNHVLFEITKFGGAAYAPAGFVSHMPGFRDSLSDEQIWAILAYIKSRWPPHIRARQAEIDRRSQAP